MAMEINKTLYITNRTDWRAWLEKNHKTEKEVWIVYYKKHTGKPGIPYDDAVEEALCFGWIDSIVKKIDEERFARKFTPRKDNSEWSESNRERVKKMIEQGRMTEAGLKKIKAIKESHKIRQSNPVAPSYMKEALMQNKKAYENFNNLAPSHKKYYIWWITDAKKEETRKRRIKEAIGLLTRNKKLGMK